MAWQGCTAPTSPCARRDFSRSLRLSNVNPGIVLGAAARAVALPDQRHGLVGSGLYGVVACGVGLQRQQAGEQQAGQEAGQGHAGDANHLTQW